MVVVAGALRGRGEGEGQWLGSGCIRSMVVGIGVLAGRDQVGVEWRARSGVGVVESVGVVIEMEMVGE